MVLRISPLGGKTMSDLIVNVLTSSNSAAKILLIVLFLGAMLGVAIYLFSCKRKLQVANAKVKYLESRNEEVSKLYDNVRTFRHDFNNMLQIIGGYIALKDIAGLEKYYKNLSIDSKNGNGFKITKITDIKEPSIFNLLFSKLKRAKEMNVNFNLISITDFENISVNIYKYARVLGVLLDNAIEAASECEIKIVNITFDFDEELKTTNCIIENTYKNKEIDLSRIYEKDYTTKPRNKNSGLGLWTIKKILDREKTLDLETKKNSIFFIQKLICECV